MADLASILAGMGIVPSPAVGAGGGYTTTGGSPAPYLPQFSPDYKPTTGTVVDPVTTSASSAGTLASPGSQQGSGLGMNFDTANLAITGLSSLANIWNAWEANKLAKDQLSFQKEAYSKNLANSMQAYNTKLEDRQGARAAYTGQDEAAVQAYIDKNRLRA